MSKAEVRGESVEPLAHSYDNPERYKAACQLYFYLVRRSAHEETQVLAAEYQRANPDQDVFIISERSAPDDYIFYRYGCAMTNDQGESIMDPIDSLNYELTREMKPLIEVDIHVYVRTKPKECQRRAKSRKRSEDSDLPLHMFKDLHDLHEQVYNGKELDHVVPQEPIDPSKVVVLNNDRFLSEEVLRSTDHPLIAKINMRLAPVLA